MESLPGRTTVRLKHEVIGVVEGIWCDRCNLPSGAELTMAVSRDDRLSSLCTVAACRDCGHRLETDHA